MNRPVFLLFTITLFMAIFSPSIAKDTITPTQPLLDNETLLSSDESFALGFFTPANTTNRYVGLWYNNIPLQTIVWVANRNNPIVNSSTGTLSITPGGSLVITDQRNSTVWSTPATALASPVAQLLDSGNLVVKEEASTSTADASSLAWQGFDYPTDTILPGMKMGINRTSGFSRNMTAWKSATDPSSGQYYSAVVLSGDPESYLWAGSEKVWRLGPWDGARFSGLPGSSTYQGFSFHFANNEEEVAYSYEITNKSIITRLLVNYTGITQRGIWIPEAGEWNFFWYAPRDQCDDYNACGPFGQCDPNKSPICDCLQGFTPKNPASWALRDGSGGCVRRTALDCGNGTDVFVTVGNAKVPDTSNTWVDSSLDLDQCRGLCLRNCSCTAYASANISGGGSGCVIWVGQLLDIRVYTNASAGQDVYVRVAAADVAYTPGKSHKNGGHKMIAIAASLVVVILLLAFLGCLLWRKKRMRLARLRITTHAHHRAQGENHDDLELPLFDVETIATATGNFSEVNKLGEGGFGPVYKGKLGEDQEIAVKRLAKSSLQGVDEFMNEVMLIAKLQHRNLVRLLGCCIQGEERMLIYEYMPNQSLDAFLFDKRKVALLDWPTRYKIITGIARGLLYLHQDSRFRVIHRDIKASNVLLDMEMNPKISDFGMARIFGGDETEVNTRKVVGTYGYMSPEYAMNGIFSVKSDVFSFGVLVLEILNGKKNRGVYGSSPDANLIVHAWNLWNEGKVLEIVDELIDHKLAPDEVLKCIKVGLLCVQEWPEDRPLMSSVILMLGNDSALLPNPRQPGFFARGSPFEIDSSSSNQDSCTSNGITISIFEGR